MPVTDISRDDQALTMTFVADFDADAERVWRVWEDPRRLERWWGPPTWPATFTRHEFTAGGQSRYYMTGPEDERPHGWWRITAVDAPRRLEFDDGFADDSGEPLADDMPMHIVVTLEPQGSATRMTTVNTFASAEQRERLLDMGMKEGMRSAMDQIDGLLTEPSR
jgi:uncharacterized protein YndB with AHSA1/START domain